MTNSPTRLFLPVCVTTLLFSFAAGPAFAIVIVIGSAARIPFSDSYHESARQQVRDSLESKNCQFLDGVSSMRVTTLNFAGDTASLNRQLQNLAKCPGAVVSVSFDDRAFDADWRVIHTVKNNRFDVVLSLRSKRIVLEDLVIPPANGPSLPTLTP